MIYLTAIGLSPGGSSTVHIYTQTIHRTTQNKQYLEQHNRKKKYIERHNVCVRIILFINSHEKHISSRSIILLSVACLAAPYLCASLHKRKYFGINVPNIKFVSIFPTTSVRNISHFNKYLGRFYHKHTNAHTSSYTDLVILIKI